MSDTTAPVRPTLVLVDAHALVYQLFHAIRGMSSADGRPTNIVFGFARDLFFFRDELKPDYLIYIFDPPGPTFRDKVVGDYKANRKPPDAELLAQEPMIGQLLAAANVPVLREPGYEADDAIATLAKAGEAKGLDVIICTSDKDCRQLVTDNIRILNLRKRIYLDRMGILADWGVTPEQAIDYQTLVGDSVDNVKGVKGVGEKTAAKLLQKFGSIDNMIANLGQLDGVVTPKIQAAIREAIETKVIETGRKLVTLDCHMPLKMEWEKWHRPAWDVEKMQALFQEWGFRTFREKLKAALPPPPPTSLFEQFESGDTEFAFGANAPAEDGWKGTYKLIDTPEKLEPVLKQLQKQKRFAFDLETTGLDPLLCDIVGIALCWKESEAYYLAVRGPEGEAHLIEEELHAKLKPIFENPKVQKINQNIKFDVNVLRSQGIVVKGIAGDSMIADYLLHSGELSHGLDDMALRYFKHQNIKIEELIGKKGKNQKTMAQVSTAKVAQYAGEDADVAWRLAELLEPQLKPEGLRTLYDELEIPLIEVLAELEFTGIRLDVPLLKQISVQMAGELENIEAAIHKLAGRKFNINSPQKLREILFDEMKLPVQKKTNLTGAASTDQETLEKLAALGHELPKHIIQQRQVSKLKGTYVDALPELVNPKTGRVHTSFNQAVATTGRLSSSDPNLQNIPMKTEQGRQIRQAFIPREGWTLLTADYSQIELRLLAHFCQDETLQAAFAEDRDIHAAVAAQIWNVPEEQVTSTQRRMAKTVNFGILYGMSSMGLGVRLGISRDEAAKFIEQYFGRYKKVLEYQQNLLTRCNQTGYVATILGRKRHIARDSVRPNSRFDGRSQPEREAINMEIQGSAADLMKQAMLNVFHRMRNEKLQSKMLLTVHDELVFEAPPEELKKLTNLVREEMTGAMKINVPLKVDIAAGKNWLDVEDV